MLFLLILLIVLTIIVFLSALQFYSVLFKNFAPYISTKPGVVKIILEEIKNLNLNLDNKKIIYELGCGRSRFLKSIRKDYKNAKLIGIEYNFFPYLISRFNVFFAKNKISIFKKNFYEVNLKDADLIYCYLNIESMKKLKEKFAQECRPGTVIVSQMFSLPETKPLKIVKAKNKTIYIYKL